MKDENQNNIGMIPLWDKALNLNIYTKGKEVHIVINGFQDKREAIDWAATQPAIYTLHEKELNTLH